MSVASLLSRRLVFTVGKGGVGRTTVTLAMALEAARQGKRVLVVELEGARGLERAFEALRSSLPHTSATHRIRYLAVDGQAALEEYLGMIIPVQRLLRTIFDSAVYRYFVAAAPGLKELMAIGKIWFEADRSRSDEDAADLVIVDAPATGHSLQYLRMPQAALEAFPVGLVHSEAERVLRLLRDPAQTSVAVVSTAEEMPANETLEIFAGLQHIGLSVGALFVNQVHRSPCEAGTLRRLRDAADVEDVEPLFREAVDRAEEEAGWADLGAVQVARLSDSLEREPVVLPYLFCEEFGPAQVRALSDLLVSEGDPGGTS